MKSSIFETQEALLHFRLTMKEIFIHQLNQKKVLQKEKLHELSCLEFGITQNQETQAMIYEWHHNIVDFGFIKEFEKEKLQEIIIHDVQNIQIINQDDKEQFAINITPEDLQLSLETLSVLATQEWSYSNPFTSFSYYLRGTQYRMTLIHSSVSPNGISKIFIRRFHENINNLSDMNLPPQIKELLNHYVNNKNNVLVTGPTGSGKTTLLKGMLNNIPHDDHLVILEDYPELNLKRKNTTQLISHEEDTKKSLKAYCSYAMRMRPDRIVLGEMRGAEVTSFLLSMNTGHKGMMATLHSNSAAEAVMRMVTLFAMYSDTDFLSTDQLVGLICQNVDSIIYMENREIKEVIELRGAENGTPYYETVFLKAA